MCFYLVTVWWSFFVVFCLFLVCVCFFFLVLKGLLLFWFLGKNLKLIGLGGGEYRDRLGGGEEYDRNMLIFKIVLNDKNVI